MTYMAVVWMLQYYFTTGKCVRWLFFHFYCFINPLAFSAWKITMRRAGWNHFKAKYHLFTVTLSATRTNVCWNFVWHKTILQNKADGRNARGNAVVLTDQQFTISKTHASVCPQSGSVQLTGVTSDIITSDGRRLGWHLSRQMYWTQWYTQRRFCANATMN